MTGIVYHCSYLEQSPVLVDSSLFYIRTMIHNVSHETQTSSESINMDIVPRALKEHISFLFDGFKINDVNNPFPDFQSICMLFSFDLNERQLGFCGIYHVFVGSS